MFNGTVEIKAIAREPGYRSKVAVAARQEGVDPVGSCVGLRGIRINNIISELNNEKVDVIQWDAEPSLFVANALSPAQVMHVDINETDKTATVIVPDRQLSLAIGKEGQNARLAAKLTGWRIDIKSSTSVETDKLERLRAAFEAPIIRESDLAEVLDRPLALVAALPLLEAEPEQILAPVAELIPVAEAAEIAVEAPVAVAPVAAAPAPAPVVMVAAAAVEAPAVAPPPRQPGLTADGQRIRFAEDIGDRERRSQTLTKREQEDAEKAKKAKKKGASRPAGRAISEEDDEVEAYDDLLRRLKR